MRKIVQIPPEEFVKRYLLAVKRDYGRQEAAESMGLGLSGFDKRVKLLKNRGVKLPALRKRSNGGRPIVDANAVAKFNALIEEEMNGGN